MEQEVLSGLVRRGVPVHIAQGMVANMIAESNLNLGINEIAPVVPGSRGGYGLNQWTGPRRRQYEAFAQERGAPLDDLDAQLDFTLLELEGPERSAFEALQGAQTAEDAARIYSERFLRPGIPNMDKRLREAARLSGAPYSPGSSSPASGSQNALAGMPAPGNPPQNALAPQEQERPEFKVQRLSAEPFMMATNALAPMPLQRVTQNSLRRA